MKQDPQIFIFAGEKSGDLHGYHLCQSLLQHLPECRLSGVVGPEMRTLNINTIMPMEEFEVMGFSDVFLSFRKIINQFRYIRDRILATKPDAVIFIDYPGFNIRMAKALRKRGYKGKLIQYIAPTFWAWGRSRIRHMANTLDLLLTIYPFESDFFSDSKLSVKYVGNPVQESVHTHRYHSEWAEILGIRPSENLIALFPGSRRSEVRRNLPIQLQAASLFQKKHPDACFAISCAHTEIMPMIQEILETNSLQLNKDLFFVPKRFSYELMRDCRSAISKSGTVTLELALHQRPTVVMYEVSKLNYFIAKNLLRLKLPHFCMANILYGGTVFPELIKGGCQPDRLAQELLLLNDNPTTRQKCINACRKIDSTLQGFQTSDKAAQAIIQTLQA